MGKKKRTWFESHVSDKYVQMAQKDNYRSRAVYKLKEIDEKYNIFINGQYICDLGSSPGSWSQYIIRKNPNSKIFAFDLLQMKPIKNVNFVQTDICGLLNSEQNTQHFPKFNLVISDIAPNITGIDASDIPAMLEIAENISNIAENLLKPRGSLIMKLFQGSGSDTFIKELKKMYNRVSIIKPKASRPKSREIYLVALEYNLNQRKSL